MHPDNLHPTGARRMTILGAVLQVLPRDGTPRSANEIHQMIVEQSLFTFRAADPVAMVRTTIRKHLREHGGAGQPEARLRELGRDRYGALV